ncbi:MAG: TetR/AcrR family transcriptional regulator [Myxococcota bacterium]
MSALRERILDATADLLATSGYASVTTNAIAKAAECSVGSVYVYFSDKHAVLAALLERYGERLLATVAQPIGTWDPQTGWRALVVAVVQAFVDFYDEEPGYRALWVGAQLPESAWSAGRSWSESAKETFGAVIQQIRPDLDALTTQTTVDVAIHAVTAVVTRGLERDDPSVVSEATPLVVRYLAPLLDSNSESEPS